MVEEIISCRQCNIVYRLCEVVQIRCTFSLNIRFFIIIGLTFSPDFEIFSGFQEMRL